MSVVHPYVSLPIAISLTSLSVFLIYSAFATFHRQVISATEYIRMNPREFPGLTKRIYPIDLTEPEQLCDMSTNKCDKLFRSLKLHSISVYDG